MKCRKMRRGLPLTLKDWVVIMENEQVRVAEVSIRDRPVFICFT
jgi:hypothetical protein